MKIARQSLILSAFALVALAPAASAQDFDFKTLDKLATNAKSVTNVTLNPDTLKLASTFLGSDGNDKDSEGLKSLVANLKAVYVRDYEYDKPGQYDKTVLDPLRAYLKQPKWTNIVDVQENGDSTQVYYKLLPNGKLGGLAVVDAEANEVAVIFVDGEMDLADMKKLSGNMGIPDLGAITGAAANATKANKKADNKTKTDK